MRIHIMGRQEHIEARPGENLSRILALKGLVTCACGMQGNCGGCAVRFTASIPPAGDIEARRFSEEQLRQGWRLSCRQRCPEEDIIIEILSPAIPLQAYVGDWSFGPPPPPGTPLTVALDIGTTTIAALLCDNSGAPLASAATANSQHIYGQDVISRLRYAQNGPAALKELQNAVLADIRRLLAELCGPLGLDTRRIREGALAGNPVMIYLLAGLSPASLATAPYRLTLPNPLLLEADALLLPMAARLYCLPAIAAYVGGDIVGGILAARLHYPGPTRLFVDIGTNGEIVLAANGQLWAASAAAGPALEGMSISSGMRAATGAIESVSLNEGRASYTTINGGQPLGLCGSGLLSAICALRKAGLLAQNGRLRLAPPLIEENEERRFIIDREANIALTQGDIRQTQLAVGAIRAAIETLLKAAQCPPENVEQVLVSGGFGANLPENSLIDTGLLPAPWAGRIHYVGNTALAGACLCLSSVESRQQAEMVCLNVKHVELAGDKEYQQRFVQYMRFPKIKEAKI